MIDDQIRQLIREIVAEAWAQFFRAHHCRRAEAMPLVLRPEARADRWASAAAALAEPTVTPDRTGYQRPEADTVNEATIWMVYGQPMAWWGVPPSTVRHAAVYWLAMRERVTGVRIS